MKNLFESLWEKYEKKIEAINKAPDKNPKDYLIEDGIDINHTSEYFCNDHKRVLFILKESNESNVDNHGRKRKSIFACGGWFDSYDTNRKDNKVITKMIKMYHYIQNPTVSTCVQTYNSSDRYKFAFININKHGNGKITSSCKSIKKALSDDADLLKEQIEILNPNVIVLGVKALEEDFREKIYKKLSDPHLSLIVTCHFSVLKYDDFEQEYKNSI